ncbi:MAG: hypothetical protein AUK21_03235 [Parcubacteria group bacterium CG2_30_48_51]|nr:MAG: hypothetical protein AUK21_03235 [Parcubacteria group bacterium CG2_30_48_51]
MAESFDRKVIFEKKNALVLGGAGFLGSHLCDELVKTRKVICVDNFVSGSEDNIHHLLLNPDFEFIKHDMKDKLDLSSYRELEKFRVQFQGIQEVYNLACPTSPKDFENRTIDTLLANSFAVCNALDIATAYKASFLHFSSSVVYGGRTPYKLYFKEDSYTPMDPTTDRSCYDEGKRFAETATVTYGKKFGFPIKILRVFRTYGPRMALGDGQMLADFVVNALEGKDLALYGDENFQTSLCYVSDIIDGAVKFMEAGSVGIMNIGHPQDFRLSDIAQKIITFTDSQSKIVYQEPLPFMTPQGLPDITKIKDELGWLPVITIDQGLKLTIDYARATKDLVRMGGKGDKMINGMYKFS